MQMDDIIAENQRLKAENIGLRLKVQDLDKILTKTKGSFETISDLYKEQSNALARALGLLESYAGCPSANLLAKLDDKLLIFFPAIARRVKENRERRNRVKVTIVDGSVKYGDNNPDLDIRRLY